MRPVLGVGATCRARGQHQRPCWFGSVMNARVSPAKERKRKEKREKERGRERKRKRERERGTDLVLLASARRMVQRSRT